MNSIKVCNSHLTKNKPHNCYSDQISGQPVAWCISDQETTDVVEMFLHSIKKRSPDAQVSVFMTDDGMYVATYMMEQ